MCTFYHDQSERRKSLWRHSRPLEDDSKKKIQKSEKALDMQSSFELFIK